MNLNEKYLFAKELVLEAGHFLREHLQDELEIETKSDFKDLVTHLDKQVQEDMTAKILYRYPNDLIFGEENENRKPISTGNVWVIDPIDGTTNFVVQQTDFAVLLAYFEEGVGRFAFIYDVMQGKMLHGGGDFPVYENDQLLPSVAEKKLTEGVMGISASLYAQNTAGLATLADATLGTRWIGSAGLGFAHVLTQRWLLQATYAYPWDYAAAGILGEKLGYLLINCHGHQPSFDGREHVLLVDQRKLDEIRGYLS